MKDWLSQNPEISALRLAIPDLNGQPRGKRVPIEALEKARNGSTRLPYSALNLDVWGDDIKDSPLVLASGDQDGVLHPTNRGLVPVPWLETPSAMLPFSMYHDDGTAFQGDPRHALSRVLDRYHARGLTPVCAMELEFYLIDDNDGTPHPPRAPRSGKRQALGDILSLSALEAFDPFFNDLYASCAAMDIPAETASTESGLGQFEITIAHGADALKAADDAWLLKLLIKGLARKHGLAASFMAKPYAQDSGTGLHMHFSVLDTEGRNVFDNGGAEGSEVLSHAVAGALAAMPGLGLIFAPHANSYERIVPGSHAPTGVCWAHENRTASLRIPGGKPQARRIEHRMPGGDTNPYLVMAAVLGGAINGIEDRALPPPPISGNAYTQDLPQIPMTWDQAMTQFAADSAVARIFHSDLIRNLVLTKRQEQRRMATLSREAQTAIYLETV